MTKMKTTVNLPLLLTLTKGIFLTGREIAPAESRILEPESRLEAGQDDWFR